jgi:hypothetical protein
MKKLLLIVSVLMPFLTFAQNEKGELRGVITYFFNDNYGNKPDVGAKVIIQKINLPTERSPIEIRLDSDLVRLQRDTLQLEEKIKRDDKDLADTNATKKKLATTKDKSVQAKKEKSIQEVLDVEQKKHEIILDTFGKFDIHSEPGNMVVQFYDKEEEEAKRYFHAQINIIDTFSKTSGESENKLKQRRLLADRQQNLTIIKIDEDRYKYLSNDLKFHEYMDKAGYESKKMSENLEISNTINNLKRAESDRKYLGEAPTKKYKNELIERLKAEDAYPEEKFNELDNKVFQMIYDIENGRDAKNTTVDGNGNYSIKLEPGIYYLVIKSKGRKNHSITEGGGQISGIDIIDIKSNETLEKSEDFKGGY